MLNNYHLEKLLLGLTLSFSPANLMAEESKPLQEPQRLQESQESQENVVRRDHFSVSSSYTTKNLAGEAYESGVGINIDVAVTIPFTKHFSIHQDLNSYSQWLRPYKDVDLERTKTQLDYSPQARFSLVKNDDLQFFIDGGMAYRRFEDSITLDDLEGYERHIGMGPKINAGFYSRNFDTVLSFSYLFGERQASYDIDRDYTMTDFGWSLTTHFWRFSLNTSGNIDWRSLGIDAGAAGLIKSVNISLQPGVEVIDHLKLFMDMEMVHRFGGKDKYNEFKIGGGTSFRWDVSEIL